LAYDLDFQSQMSYGHDPHTHKTQIPSPVGSKDGVKTNRRTEEQKGRYRLLHLSG